MDIITEALVVFQSDFYNQTDLRDRKTITKFLLTHSQLPATVTDEQWLAVLPRYVVPDVERAIRNIKNVNRKLSRDLTIHPIKIYRSPSDISHRKVRS